MSRGPILIDEVKIVGKGEIDALELNLYNNGKNIQYRDHKMC